MTNGIILLTVSIICAIVGIAQIVIATQKTYKDDK